MFADDVSRTKILLIVTPQLHIVDLCRESRSVVESRAHVIDPSLFAASCLVFGTTSHLCCLWGKDTLPTTILRCIFLSLWSPRSLYLTRTRCFVMWFVLNVPHSSDVSAVPFMRRQFAQAMPWIWSIPLPGVMVRGGSLVLLFCFCLCVWVCRLCSR